MSWDSAQLVTLIGTSLAALFSFLNWRSTGNRKIAEQRQIWINDLVNNLGRLLTICVMPADIISDAEKAELSVLQFRIKMCLSVNEAGHKQLDELLSKALSGLFQSKIDPKLLNKIQNVAYDVVQLEKAKFFKELKH